MKTVKLKLEAIQDHVNTIIEQRQHNFDEKSEAWQDSEKGEIYEEKTDDLDYVVNDITSLIDSIDTFLE